MPTPNACRPVSLARGKVARVEVCADCGCVSLHVGPSTVRMDEHTLRRLWITLGRAVEELERPPLLPYPVTPRGTA